jgi:hypothetical protein
VLHGGRFILKTHPGLTIELSPGGNQRSLGPALVFHVCLRVQAIRELHGM